MAWRRVSHFDQTNAACTVFTFKDGLLSSVAHDLRLSVERFAIDVDEDQGTVLASFDPGSLRVEMAMSDGIELPGRLSLADRSKIESQILTEVLHVARYPSVTFRSHSLLRRGDGGYDVKGELTLHGRTRPLVAQTRRAAGRQQLEITLRQPDFGITPYRALLGTLKIQSDVKVRLAL